MSKDSCRSGASHMMECDDCYRIFEVSKGKRKCPHCGYDNPVKGEKRKSDRRSEAVSRRRKQDLD